MQVATYHLNQEAHLAGGHLLLESGVSLCKWSPITGIRRLTLQVTT